MKTTTLASIILFALVLVTSCLGQPAFPTNLVVKLNRFGSVTVAWDASPSTNVASYGVLVGVRTGVYNVRQDGPSNKLTMTITNLPAGATYYFAAVATSPAGFDSELSNEIAVNMEKPAAPKGVRTTQIDATLEASRYPDGPWTELQKFPPVTQIAEDEQRFYRVQLFNLPGPRILE